MKTYNKLKPFISLVCSVALLFSILCVPVAAVDGNSVTATTSTSIKQGGSGVCYVYIDSTESLAALDVAVHFDPTKIKINSVYNSVSCTLYDNVKNTDNVQFSYIFDGKGSASKTRLFYFNYQVLSNAEVGDTYFDVSIGEAYDSSLNDVTVSGSRTRLEITETVTTKSCTVSGSSSVSTSIEEEFSLNYRFSTYQIASGSVVITYDPQLFEVVEVTNGTFLGEKISDINTDLSGAIYLSFVGTKYITKYDILTIKFKTLKNTDETSEITFNATELYDLDLNAISCEEYKTTATVRFDDSYVGDAPKMTVSAEYDQSTDKVLATITLEENSVLGAGDFTLAFDPTMLKFVSYEKKFSPTFFNINDKEIADGLFKFSIISLEDIVTAENVIRVAFDVVDGCGERTAALSLHGNVTTDSLTNAILLNYIDGQVDLPQKHTYGDWITDVAATETTTGSKHRKCTCGVTETAVIPQTLKFATAALTLQSNIAINFKVNSAMFNEYGYTDPYAVFTIYDDEGNTEETIVSEYRIEESTSRYLFDFENIAPNRLNDTVEGVLYAKYNGEWYQSAIVTYSAATYCYRQLNNATVSSNAAYAEFRTLLVDLLNYGAATQLHTGYRTDALANAKLTETQASWGTSTTRKLINDQDAFYETVENSLAAWKGAGLNLKDAVVIRLKLEATDIEGLSVKIVGKYNTWEIDSDKFDPVIGENNRYYIYFDSLDASQMSEKIYATIYKDGVAVSNTLQYTIETYAAKNAVASTTLGDLLISMMKYGDAANKYVN